MKYVIKKAYWNYEKEEKWLNDMAAKGLAMTDYSRYRYVFEDAQPGEYIYRIELLDNVATHPESRKYISFVEETGAQFVTSYIRWVYFRKKAADGPFVLYSDLDSRIAHYRRVRRLWLGVAVAEGIAFATNLFNTLYAMPFAINIFLTALLGAMWGVFSLMSLIVTRRIRILRREKRIVEG